VVASIDYSSSVVLLCLHARLGLYFFVMLGGAQVAMNGDVYRALIVTVAINGDVYRALIVTVAINGDPTL